MNRTLRTFAAVLCLVVLPGLIEPGPASADPLDSCTPTSGVIVAVDFGHWGGSVQRGCDATPTTGFDALHAAGFSTAGTRHDGPGFICRINNYPTPAEEACVLTPPASAYWSYWHANPGQDSWSYSNLGATSYHPKPGSVDAWVFGGTDTGGTYGGPSFTPAAVRASVAHPRATPTPRASTPAASARPPSASVSQRPSTPGTVGPTPTVAAPRRSGSAQRSLVAGSPTTSAHPPSGSGDSGSGAAPLPSPSTDSASGGPGFVDVASTANGGGKSSGSPVPVLLAVTIAAGLAAGAGWATRRRRQGG